MPNPDDLFRDLFSQDETEDRTVYIRETDTGERIDFEVIERTSFSSAYPATVKELRSKQPLACGHLVDKANPFGGYCQCRGRLRRKPCGKEYCSLYCGVICPRCAISVGPCCARAIDGVFYCKSCKRTLTARRLLSGSVAFLLAPFVSETLPDD